MRHTKQHDHGRQLQILQDIQSMSGGSTLPLYIFMGKSSNFKVDFPGSFQSMNAAFT